MSAANFDACFAETEAWEGWHQFSNDPHDPGGATWCGLTARSYDAWRKQKGLHPQFVRRASDEEIKQIFREEYWNRARCDDCFDGLDLMQFDIAINAGAVIANKMLQRSLGVAADGVFSLETLGKLQGVTLPEARRELIDRVASQRLGFWETLRNWRFFGSGWRARGEGIRTKALKMAAICETS